MDVKDFIDEMRSRLGDTSQSIPSAYVISYLNTMLRRTARAEGLEKLFQHRDTFELASINADGTAAAGWDLGNIGKIIDIDKMRILKASESGISELRPKFVEYDEFFDYAVLPEQQAPGDPDYYTIEQIGSLNRLLFNRPPKNLVAIDMKYSAFHERITDAVNGKIYLDWNYLDYILDGVIILHKIETTDMATARALYEDLDVLLVDMKEQLARRKTSLGYRRVRRSF